MRLKLFISRLLGFDVNKVPYSTWSDTNRMSFPALNLSQCSKIQHFGGFYHLNDNNDSPNNYFAVTCQVQRSLFDEYPNRILCDLADQSSNVIDFILHFKGTSRPLCAFRVVHFDPAQITLLSPHSNEESTIGSNDHTNQPDTHSLGSLNIHEDQSEDVEGDKPNVKDLKEILSCITVPVRIELIESEVTVMTSRNNSACSKDDVRDAQVLSLLRDGDLRRHLMASRFDLKDAAVRAVKSAAWYVKCI
jgi:hypothetical protein